MAYLYWIIGVWFLWVHFDIIWYAYKKIFLHGPSLSNIIGYHSWIMWLFDRQSVLLRRKFLPRKYRESNFLCNTRLYTNSMVFFVHCSGSIRSSRSFKLSWSLFRVYWHGVKPGFLTVGSFHKRKTLKDGIDRLWYCYYSVNLSTFSTKSSNLINFRLTLHFIHSQGVRTMSDRHCYNRIWMMPCSMQLLKEALPTFIRRSIRLTTVIRRTIVR